MAQFRRLKHLQLLGTLSSQRKIIEYICLILQLITILIFSNQFNLRLGWERDSVYRQYIRSMNLEKIVFDSDLASVEHIRMDRRAFHELCHLLKMQQRLKSSKNMDVEEIVAIFLYIISHDVKNRVIKRQVTRSSSMLSSTWCCISIHVVTETWRCERIV